ncbi:MAG: AAA family ATPase [Candidatus Bathyarchaeia archaeon]
MSRYGEVIELERELMRREREIEYLRMELKRCYAVIEELKQGMRPVGTVQEVRGNLAYVKLTGGQSFEVTVPPDLAGKVSRDSEVVLAPNRGTVTNVIERPKEASIWAFKVETAPRVYYEDVVGLETQLAEFRKAVEVVLNPTLRERREKIVVDGRLLEEAGSVLLFGPPGTGKTYMAKAAAGSASRMGQPTSFLKIEGYEVVSKWLGESAKNIREVFKLAREVAPSILFIDEADAIGRMRMEAATDAGRDVQGMLNQLLVELGEGFDVNRNVVVLFATNFPSVMDPALLDRIKKVIYVPPLKTREEIKRVFDFYASKVKLDPVLVDRGRLSDSAFEEVWQVLRRRRQVYEATVPRRQIRIRDEYIATPRDVKNIVQEAASDASYEGMDFIDHDTIIERARSIANQPVEINTV